MPVSLLMPREWSMEWCAPNQAVTAEFATRPALLATTAAQALPGAEATRPAAPTIALMDAVNAHGEPDALAMPGPRGPRSSINVGGQASTLFSFNPLEPRSPISFNATTSPPARVPLKTMASARVRVDADNLNVLQAETSPSAPASVAKIEDALMGPTIEGSQNALAVAGIPGSLTSGAVVDAGALREVADHTLLAPAGPPTLTQARAPLHDEDVAAVAIQTPVSLTCDHGVGAFFKGSDKPLEDPVPQQKADLTAALDRS